MTRRSFAWTWVPLLLALAGCNSLQRDAEDARDQWEPEIETAAATTE